MSSTKSLDSAQGGASRRSGATVALHSSVRAPLQGVPDLEQIQAALDAGARPVVSMDPEILGGEAVFNGTRVPIDMVIACVHSAAPFERMRAAYPCLTEALVQAALAWRAAHPREGVRAPVRDRTGWVVLRRRVVRGGFG